MRVSHVLQHIPHYDTGQGRRARGTGQGKAGQGKAGQGKAGQGKAGQGKAGQGKAGQGKAGQGACSAADLGRAENRGRLQLPVVLLLPGVNDQSHVTAAVRGELPESSDDVVLDGKPATKQTPRAGYATDHKEGEGGKEGRFMCTGALSQCDIPDKFEPKQFCSFCLFENALCPGKSIRFFCHLNLKALSVDLSQLSAV